MNLSSIAGPIVAAVNPWTAATYQASTGISATGGDGTRSPAYATAVPVFVQAQALTWGDLQQMTNLNIQGEKLALYIKGNWQSIARPDLRGGDLFTITADGSRWLVVQVLENWNRMAGWAKVAAVRQA